MVTSKTVATRERVTEGRREVTMSPDSIIIPLDREDIVPMMPLSTDRSPIDMANPGFSSAPRATGYQLSTDSKPSQPWRSKPSPRRR